MSNSVNFFENYTASADIVTIFVCVVIIILMNVSYIKKEQNFIIFRRLPFFIIIAAEADIIYHTILNAGGRDFKTGAYVAYAVVHVSLILTLYMYMSYIRATMWREDFRWFRMTYMIRTVVALSIALMLALPFIGRGMLIPFEPYIFAGAYTANMAILIFMVYHSREHVYGRILMGVCGSTLLSVVLMYMQLLHRQTSYTCATFLFPAIALLYLIHSNPYDFALGSLDEDAFTDIIAYSYMHSRKIYLMSLYMHDIESGAGSIPKEVSQKARFYGEKIFKGSQLFRISDGHLILAFNIAKNPDYEAKIQDMLAQFYTEYETYNIDYKIVFMRTIKEISEREDYIPFIQYLHGRMEENSVLRVTDEDIAGYNKHVYILEQLMDIDRKKDLNDPRVLVFCQPVFNTQTGYYDTAEALMRLKLPETGMVFPDQFIPLAEKYDIIHALSMIILAKTCAQIKKLIDEGYYVKRISVNFSMIDVRKPDFADKVKGIVSVIGIPFEKVAIEITESQSEEEFNVVKERIAELRDSGIKFYLDDFGTGYSSFERIMELPFDIIKFDRSLTIASGLDVKLETMVSYLAHMFTDLRYAVLYEGIENDDDENRCVNMCARYLQGYKYSKPIPIERLTEYFVKA